MNWEYVTIILGSIGGLEFFKFLYNLFLRRKTDARLAIAEAKTAEFKHLQEINEWLQSQLQAKEERFQEQTDLVRRLNTEVLNLTSSNANNEIKFAQEVARYEILLAEVRCDILECPNRQPPNTHTKPQLTKKGKASL